MTDTAQQRRNRLKGIALMCGAVATFAVLDSMAKYLGSGRMDMLQVVAARYIMAFVLTFIVINPINHPNLFRTKSPGLQVARALTLLACTGFNFTAFRFLQLDEALSIMFSTPFLVAILAGPVLGEWVGWRRWSAIIVGFVGVLIVIRPGVGGGMQWATLLSVAAAIFYALYGIATRMVWKAGESSDTTLLYSNMIGAAVMLPVLPFVWTTPQSWLDVVLMCAIGALASFGHYLLILAHRHTPASVLSPFMYTQLIWATALGFSVFGNVPNPWTLAGGAIIVGSGLYLIARERKLHQATVSESLHE